MSSSSPLGAPNAEPMPALLVPRPELATSLRQRINTGEDYQLREVTGVGSARDLADDVTTWHEYNGSLLKRSFSNSEIAENYLGFPLTYEPNVNAATVYFETTNFLSDRVRRLKSVLEQLELYLEVGRVDDRNVSRPHIDAQTVFIVHGQNNEVKASVSEFVRELTGQKPTILHEQPNGGLTIIEKFERYAASAGFAIVLLTADDLGGTRGSSDQSKRARQNVILELGFFIAAIGRQRVAALHEAEVEIPSDIAGLLYTSLESNWKHDLFREMRAAGISVDYNNVT
jgi:predicted nucleotide-binding protein